MKNNLTKFALFFSLAAVIASCSKKDSTATVTLSATSVSNLSSDPGTGNHYSFYSLERNEAVALADSNSNKWDIAIRSTTILTNGGTSGPGFGGAYVQRATAFDNFKTIPADSTFRTDAGASLAIPTGSGNGWYNYDFTSNLISPVPGNVIVVRTATGKYAKIEILSYYKDAPAAPTSASTSRYYTFRFVYQSNGSKSF